MSMLIIPSLQQAKSKGSVRHTHNGMTLDCHSLYYKWLQTIHARGIVEVKVWGSHQEPSGICHLEETRGAALFLLSDTVSYFNSKTSIHNMTENQFILISALTPACLLFISLSADLVLNKRFVLTSYCAHNLTNQHTFHQKPRITVFQPLRKYRIL